MTDPERIRRAMGVLDTLGVKHIITVDALPVCIKVDLPFEELPKLKAIRPTTSDGFTHSATFQGVFISCCDLVGMDNERKARAM